MKAFLNHLLILSVLLLPACTSIYEFPEAVGVDPTWVKVRMHISVDFIQEYESEINVTRSGGNEIVPRIIVEVYSDDNPYSDDIPAELYQSAPLYRKVIPVENPKDGLQRIPVDLELRARPYRIIAWADYSQGGECSDLYYETSRLHSISYTENYCANTDLRDAFWATCKLNLSPFNGKWFTAIEKEINLTRPLARYEIITQDLEPFALQLAKSKEPASRAEMLEELQSYRVVVRHQGFCPNEFDAAAGKLADACQSMSFEGSIKHIDGHNAILAYDYLMTGEEDSSVSVSIDIYNGKSELIKQIPVLQIPFRRNTVTRIYGKFFTDDYKPGIGINPEYDGEFNIYL